MNLTTFFLLFGLCGLQLTGLGQSYFRVGLKAGPKASISYARLGQGHVREVSKVDWTTQATFYLELLLPRQGLTIELGLKRNQHIANFILKNTVIYPNNNFPNEKFIYKAWEIPLLIKANCWKNKKATAGINLVGGVGYFKGKVESVYLSGGAVWLLDGDPWGQNGTSSFEIETFYPRIPTEGLLVYAGFENYYRLAPFLHLTFSCTYSSAVGEIMDTLISFDDGFNPEKKPFDLRSDGEGVDISLGLAVSIGGSKGR